MSKPLSLGAATPPMGRRPWREWLADLLGVRAAVPAPGPVSEEARAEAQLRLAAEAAGVGTFSYDPGGTGGLTLSEQCRVNYGLAPREPVTLRRMLDELILPEDRARVVESLRETRERRDCVETEYRIRRPSDGAVRWMAVRRQRLDGVVVGTAMDVTDRLATAEALRVNEQRHDLALQGAGLGTFYCPAPLDKIFWNDRCKEFFFLPPDAEVTFDLFYERIHPQDRERVRVTVNAAMRDRTLYDVEYRVVAPDDSGRMRWLHAVGRGYYDEATGALQRFDGVALDVTAVRQGAERLELLRAALESANDAVIITETRLDAPGPRIEYVNPAFTRMTGWTMEEIVSQTPRLLQGPKTSRRLLDRLRADLLAGRDFYGEGINYRKDGTTYHVEWRITALRDPVSGEVSKWVAVQRDVTERFQAEQRREELLEAERAARIETERTGRMKDEFLSTLSHELRTPLNAILGWARILRETDGEMVPPEDLSQGLEVIERNARAQAQLVEDLLDMSRVVSGKLRLEVRPMDPAEAVHAAAASVRPAAVARQIVIHEEVPALPGAVMADAARLQQIVWNLLSNAIKFTPPGGRVEVAVCRAGGHVEIAVRDSGQGIATDFLPFVFDRFRQADGSASRRHGGLGLGLSIVKQLVELHGGTVGAESAGEGQGAVFTVRLPGRGLFDRRDGTALDGVAKEGARDGAELLPPEPDPADLPTPRGIRSPEHPVSRPRPLAGVRVLAVEDEADARRLLQRVLEDAGAEVFTADGGETALQLLGTARPGVLVSDLGMPEMDGYALIARVRAMSAAEGGTVPALALTAFARSEDRQRALAAGYEMHLPKPFEATELVASVAGLARIWGQGSTAFPAPAGATEPKPMAPAVGQHGQPTAPAGA